MAAEHSWDRRVDTYVDLFRQILSTGMEELLENEDLDMDSHSKR
jgi:hypothetical protein